MTYDRRLASAATPAQPVVSASVSLPATAGNPSSLLTREMAERIRLIKQAPIFAALSAADYHSIARRARIQIFARNELLFMQGQPCQHLTVLSSGCVKLTHLTPNGSEVLLALRGPRDALHLPSSLPLAKHTFTARAMIAGEALTWSLLAFEDMLATVPSLRINISGILNSELSELQERYYELSVEKVEKRLACTLLRLASQIGNPSVEGREVLLSREELAQMIGATLFTVSRILSRWAELGWVLPRREAVVIVKPALLELQDSTAQQPFPVLETNRSTREPTREPTAARLAHARRDPNTRGLHPRPSTETRPAV